MARVLSSSRRLVNSSSAASRRDSPWTAAEWTECPRRSSQDNRGGRLFRKDRMAARVQQNGVFKRAQRASRPLRTVVAEVARNVSATRSVAHRRCRRGRRGQRNPVATSNEQSYQENDGCEPHLALCPQIRPRNNGCVRRRTGPIGDVSLQVLRRLVDVDRVAPLREIIERRFHDGFRLAIGDGRERISRLRIEFATGAQMRAGCWPVAPRRLTTTFVVSAPSFVSIAVPDSLEPDCGAIVTFTESTADAAAAKPRTPRRPRRARVRLPMSRMVPTRVLKNSGVRRVSTLASAIVARCIWEGGRPRAVTQSMRFTPVFPLSRTLTVAR
jgi:hypothetical protein